MIDIWPNEGMFEYVYELASSLSEGERTKGQQYEHLYDAVQSPELKSLLSSLHGALWSHCNFLRLFEREGRALAYLNECGSTFARLVKSSRDLCVSIRTEGLSVEVDDTWEGAFALFDDSEAFAGAVCRMPLDDFKSKQIFRVVRCAMVEESGAWHAQRLKWIGCGAFADTFAFDDSPISHDIALKVAKKGISDNELASFRREYSLMQAVESENVLGVFDYVDNADAYVMELMDGNLRNYVLSDEYPGTAKRVALLRQLLTGIEDINAKGILHRDLSPDNILVKFGRSGPTVKVADFGLAKADEDDEGTWDGPVPGLFNDKASLSRVGFENYGIEHETYAATLLSLFVLTRCLLKGHQGCNDKDNLKGPLRRTVLKGLCEDLSSRYQSVHELSGALEMVYPLLLT